MKMTRALARVLACIVLFIPVFAIAQTIPPSDSIVAPSSFLYDVWTIVQPVVALLVATIGPVIVGWLAARLAALIRTSDENTQKALEAQLREALHQSALNALKYASAKYGLGLAGAAIELTGKSIIDSKVMTEALKYIRNKNPDAVYAFNLDDKALSEIVLSKVPDVKAILAAGEAVDQQKAAAR